MSALLVLALMGQLMFDDSDRPPPLLRRATTSWATLEFAPASGVGMGAACACTAISSPTGQVYTATRASSAVCSKKGKATTGIADGDLVTCAANVPRVEAQSSGVLGQRFEGARSNSLLRSESGENPVWQRFGIVTPPTANYATSPYGTTTATRLEVTTCAGSASVIFQDYTGTAATWTASIYLRGTSGSGSVSLYFFDVTAGAGNAVQCAYVTTEWRRCSITRTFLNTTHRVGIGCQNDASITGNLNTGAADVLTATAMSESGAFATSPIPTTSAVVTRNEDYGDFAFGFSPTAGYCQAATMEYLDPASPPGGGGTTGGVLTTGAAGAAITATYIWPFVGFTGGYAAIDSGGAVSAGAASWNPGITAPTFPSRYLYRHDGTAWTACTNNTCQTSGGSTWGTPAFTRLKLDRASSGAANFSQHIISQVQVDLNWSRCSP